MNLKAGAYFRQFLLAGVFVAAMGSSEAPARDAAFIDPGLSAAGADDGAIKVEPKADIDTGETVLNVAKRITLFYVNQTNQPVQVEKMTVNADGNVTAEISNDDCSKQATIGPLSRCTVEISVTPTSAGPWGVDALLTHNGAGRIARAKLTGKTSGSTAASEKKDTGLALSTKEVAPVNFGDVEVGSGKAVRSALMVNDSPEPITLYSIDVIEAGNGLQRLDQGCAIDMELKPGESCPVTLVWTPSDRGQVSTDLIIRHSGRLGFAVIPIRGSAKAPVVVAGKDKETGTGKTITVEGKGSGSIPPPPSAQDLEKAANIAPISASSLNTNMQTSAPAAAIGVLRLIGTVGNRGVFLTPEGNTAVSGTGEDFDSDGKKIKVINVTAKTADITIDGKKKTLILGAAPELTAKAPARSSAADTPPGNSGGPATMGIPGGSASITPVSAPAGASATPPLVAPSAPTTLPAGAMK